MLGYLLKTTHCLRMDYLLLGRGAVGLACKIKANWGRSQEKFTQQQTIFLSWCLAFKIHFNFTLIKNKIIWFGENIVVVGLI